MGLPQEMTQTPHMLICLFTQEGMSTTKPLLAVKRHHSEASEQPALPERREQVPEFGGGGLA